MPSLDQVIRRFRAADRQLRLETLLDYARKLPPIPEHLAAQKAQGLARVHECQSPVFLWVEVENDIVHLHADAPPEAPTVRGFVSLLIATLDGRPTAEVRGVPDDLLDQLGLTEAIGMTRTQGLNAVLWRVKRAVGPARH
jgi:cysteine desulfuration protein SufE